MKRKLLKISIWLAGVFLMLLALNIQVTTRQAVNYKISVIRIPLYLKILDFLDRHYNYAQLVKSIISGAKTDEERVIRLFRWTYENIKRSPQGMPIMDDHVWYIIVRGYGAGEQSSDVFTTLCNYAGLDAFYYWVPDRTKAHKIVLSFVKTSGGWVILDQYHGVYFKSNNNGFANIEEIKSGKYAIESIWKASAVDYGEYFVNLPGIEEMGQSRGKIQSPINRLNYQMRKWMGIK